MKLFGISSSVEEKYFLGGTIERFSPLSTAFLLAFLMREIIFSTRQGLSSAKYRKYQYIKHRMKTDCLLTFIL
jgi:hypothetical protein